MIHCFTAAIKFFSCKEAALKSKGDSVCLCVISKPNFKMFFQYKCTPNQF